jgi:hypothetical protein
MCVIVPVCEGICDCAYLCGCKCRVCMCDCTYVPMRVIVPMCVRVFVIVPIFVGASSECVCVIVPM